MRSKGHLNCQISSTVKEEDKVAIYYGTDNYGKSKSHKQILDQIVVTEKNSMERIEARPRYEQNYRRESFRGNMTPFQNPGRQNSREHRGDYRNENCSRDRGRNRSKERSFSRNSNISGRNQ